MQVQLPSVQADGGGVVSRNGRVGPLQLGKSGMAAVRRFAGRPAKITRGRGEGGVPLTEFRYRCGSGCTTLFLFDRRGLLANFITRSSRYRTASGTRVGHSQTRAEEQEHKAAVSGPCSQDYGITRRGRAELHVGITGERVGVLAASSSNTVLGC